MSVYHQYTKKIRAGYLALYWCEKCQKYNIAVVNSVNAVTYNDKGAYTRAIRDKREEAADVKAREWLGEVETGLLDGDVRIFRKANLKHMCPKCKKTPLWANMDFSLLDSAALLALIAALFVWYFTHDSGTSPLLYVLLAVSALSFIGKHVLCKVCEAKIKKDMGQHMLIFSRSLDDLKQKAKAHRLYANNINWPEV